MKHTLVAAALVCGLSYSSESMALSLEDQNHILQRISFGAEAHPQDAFKNSDRKQTVTLLLDSVDTTISATPPGWLGYAIRSIDYGLPLADGVLRKFKNALNKVKRERRAELKAWWLQQIHQGTSPVAERLVLFWHNYFTTQIEVLPNPVMSWDQQLLLRRHAMGNYRHLLRSMNKNPALLWYLDNHLNNRKKPNENYARELLELYTLGEGHYSEKDVKELARAMSGAGVDKSNWEYRFQLGRHDQGMKSFLGTESHLMPDEIIDIVLQKARASEYLVERLWVEFVSPEPDKKVVKELAAVFRKSDYELRPLLQALFEHSAFWSKSNRLTLVKSPVELLVSTHLQAEAPIEKYSQAVVALRDMGQDLFSPQDVGGWPEGDEWINSVRLAARHKYQVGIGKPSGAQLELNYQLK